MTAPVIIAGGGPAGAAAARVLYAAGCPVVLVEKAAPGRDKACGDALLPGALAELARFGIDAAALRAAGGVPAAGIALEREGRALWQIDYPDGPPWVVRRRSLDQLLRERSLPDPQILYNTSVTGITPAPEGPVVMLKSAQGDETRRAAAVILASGATNALARSFGVDGAPEGAISVTAYGMGRAEEALVFDLAAEARPGYRWRFPAAGGGLNAGICLMRQGHGLIDPAKRHAVLRDHGIVQTEPWRGGIGWLWSGKGHRWHHPAGILAAGDAAGLVDPITGEGIGPALVSGRMAGEAVLGYLAGDAHHGGALAQYSRRIEEEFAACYAPSALRAAWSSLVAA